LIFVEIAYDDHFYMMKNLPFLMLSIVLLAFVLSAPACTKVNKDQPCGTYQVQTVTEQLYKDSNGNCYYVDPASGQKVMVPNSTCNC